MEEGDIRWTPTYIYAPVKGIATEWRIAVWKYRTANLSLSFLAAKLAEQAHYYRLRPTLTMSFVGIRWSQRNLRTSPNGLGKNTPFGGCALAIVPATVTSVAYRKDEG